MNRIESFDFDQGRLFANKYEIVDQIGYGWEGEVYKIIERPTGIERAAKFLYPQRNMKDRTAIMYAKKLHRLRHCPVIIQYHTRETVTYKRCKVAMLISEYVDGEQLTSFVNRQPGKRLMPFQALHLLHSLVIGLQQIHLLNEYHGDLHEENILVNRFGLGFELKLIDIFQQPGTKKENMKSDILHAINIFHWALGGKKHYAKQPNLVKNICKGLRHDLILQHFPTSAHLREYIENACWDD